MAPMKAMKAVKAAPMKAMKAAAAKPMKVAKPMKAATPKPMKAKAMRVAGKPLSKGGLSLAIAEECELKSSTAGKIISSLAAIATKEVQKNGIFTFPGLC